MAPVEFDVRVGRRVGEGLPKDDLWLIERQISRQNAALVVQLGHQIQRVAGKRRIVADVVPYERQLS